MMNDQLRAAAQVGDVDLLYTLIRQDPHVLELFDKIPFVDTPLHIAASAGHLQFATEIMWLKPSFPFKLNQQGLSPIHLAIQQGDKRMVLRFVDTNKALVRVKGREGMTPLHLVSKTGDIDLLAKFLTACPDSIEDLTVRSETALHIAVRNQQFEALKVLVGWLKRNKRRGAIRLEKAILNWKNKDDNTILHISAALNDLQALKLLIKNNKMINLKAKNLQKETALDIAGSVEIENILVRAGAKRGFSVGDGPTLENKLASKITVMDRIIIYILRIRGEITEDERNALLVVAVLVAAAIFAGALSPPGGVYQADAKDMADAGANNPNTSFSLNNMTRGNAGKSVMIDSVFLGISVVNTIALSISTLIIHILKPSGVVGDLMIAPMYYFVMSYFFSMVVISPPGLNKLFFMIIIPLFVILHTLVNIRILYTRLGQLVT